MCVCVILFKLFLYRQLIQYIFIITDIFKIVCKSNLVKCYKNSHIHISHVHNILTVIDSSKREENKAYKKIFYVQLLRITHYSVLLKSRNFDIYQYACSSEERFSQDFLVILKHLLQNY